MPLLSVFLSAETGVGVVVGTVDSGAGRTLLPLGIAGLLGLSTQDLIEDEFAAKGVESGEDDEGFPTWSSTVPITGQVVRYDPQTSNPELWGPEFAMDPAFSEQEWTLLGRADFFQAFIVTFFLQAIDQPAFALDY